MKIVVFQATSNSIHKKTLSAFAKGCNCQVSKDYIPCDIAVVFGLVKWKWRLSPYPLSVISGLGETNSVEGIRKISQIKPVSPPSIVKERILKRHRGDVIVVEMGFIDRKNYYSVGWNGINGKADFLNENMDDTRWKALNKSLVPWKSNGDYILVIGQVPWDINVQDTDHIVWCQETVNKIKDMGFKVVFRPHPLAHGVNYKVNAAISRLPLNKDLERAKAVVVWNSNVGVDAVLAGVPVIECSGASMVKNVSNSLDDIYNLKHFDRKQWANDIAYSQWTIDEISQGLAFSHLMRFRKKIKIY